LLQGPNLANKIIDVLICFRKERVAIVADIQEMFHQVRVPDNDCDSLRFLCFPQELGGAVESTWPTTLVGELSSDDPEVLQGAQANLLYNVEPSSFDQLLKRYSTWKTLKVKLIWLTRFKSHLRNHHAENGCNCPRGNPTSAELEEAEHDIIKVIQQNEYPTELETLRSGKDRVKISSNIAKLNPFIGQDELLRVGSRLEHAVMHL
jgi:hypothetical protein